MNITINIDFITHPNIIGEVYYLIIPIRICESHSIIIALLPSYQNTNRFSF